MLSVLENEELRKRVYAEECSSVRVLTCSRIRQRAKNHHFIRGEA